MAMCSRPWWTGKSRQMDHTSLDYERMKEWKFGCHHDLEIEYWHCYEEELGHSPFRFLAQVVGRCALRDDTDELKLHLELLSKCNILPYIIDEQDRLGVTALHFAVASENLDLVKLLLRYGANVNIQDKLGFSAIFWATGRYPNVAIARHLIKSGKADVNALTKTGKCALHGAAIKGNKESVKLLLQHGCNPKVADRKGVTPLDVASNEEIKKLLLKNTSIEGGDTTKEKRDTKAKGKQRETVKPGEGFKVGEAKGKTSKDEVATVTVENVTTPSSEMKSGSSMEGALKTGCGKDSANDKKMGGADVGAVGDIKDEEDGDKRKKNAQESCKAGDEKEKNTKEKSGSTKNTKNKDAEDSDVCVQCGKPSTDLKRCGRCHMTKYCSRDCQASHWKDGGHKNKCKGFAIGRPVGEFLQRQGQGYMLNLNHNNLAFQSPIGCTITTKQSAKKGGSRAEVGEKKFIVKVQVPIGDPHGDMMVYNESRSVNGFISYREQAKVYQELRSKVANEGFMGLKAFFWCKMMSEKDGSFKVFHGEFASFQTW